MKRQWVVMLAAGAAGTAVLIGALLVRNGSLRGKDQTASRSLRRLSTGSVQSSSVGLPNARDQDSRLAEALKDTSARLPSEVFLVPVASSELEKALEGYSNGGFLSGISPRDLSDTEASQRLCALLRQYIATARFAEIIGLLTAAREACGRGQVHDGRWITAVDDGLRSLNDLLLQVVTNPPDPRLRLAALHVLALTFDSRPQLETIISTVRMSPRCLGEMHEVLITEFSELLKRVSWREAQGRSDFRKSYVPDLLGFYEDILVAGATGLRGRAIETLANFANRAESADLMDRLVQMYAQCATEERKSWLTHADPLRTLSARQLFIDVALHDPSEDLRVEAVHRLSYCLDDPQVCEACERVVQTGSPKCVIRILELMKDQVEANQVSPEVVRSLAQLAKSNALIEIRDLADRVLAAADR